VQLTNVCSLLVLGSSCCFCSGIPMGTGNHWWTYEISGKPHGSGFPRLNPQTELSDKYPQGGGHELRD